MKNKHRSCRMLSFVLSLETNTQTHKEKLMQHANAKSYRRRKRGTHANRQNEWDRRTLPSKRSTSFCNLAILRSARSARCSAYTHEMGREKSVSERFFVAFFFVLFWEFFLLDSSCSFPSTYIFETCGQITNLFFITFFTLNCLKKKETSMKIIDKTSVRSRKFPNVTQFHEKRSLSRLNGSLWGSWSEEEFELLLLNRQKVNRDTLSFSSNIQTSCKFTRIPLVLRLQVISCCFQRLSILLRVQEFS